jgi:hypothetical protein
MYVYEMGIVDFYNGMMPLLEYIKLCPAKGTPGETQYLTYRELKSFLIKSFMEVKTSSSEWDGDIRNFDEIAISGIPRPTGMSPWKLLVFKQDNDGSSFLVSECKLHINETDADEGMKFLTSIEQKIDHRDLINMFYDCFDLVEILFDKALDLIEMDTKFSAQIKEIILPYSSKQEDERFDLNNYVAL